MSCLWRGVCTMLLCGGQKFTRCKTAVQLSVKPKKYMKIHRQYISNLRTIVFCSQKQSQVLMSLKESITNPQNNILNFRICMANLHNLYYRHVCKIVLPRLMKPRFKRTLEQNAMRNGRLIHLKICCNETQKRKIEPRQKPQIPYLWSLSDASRSCVVSFF